MSIATGTQQTDHTLDVDTPSDVDEPTSHLKRGTDEVKRVHELEQSLGAKTISKGLATVAIAVVVLNTIFGIEAIANSSGPFADVITTVETIGGSALTLVVVGFLALGGAVAMRYMDRF